MSSNITTQNKVVDQLVQYFSISDNCLDGLVKALDEVHGGLVDSICHKVDSDSEDNNSQLNVKVVDENISPKSESLTKNSQLNGRQAQSISGPVSDPLRKFEKQLNESESAVLGKQDVIKKKIQAKIGDTRQIVTALMGQAQFLQVAELCQAERKQIIKDSKTIKNNLQENFKKISKHIRNSKITDIEKDVKIENLKRQTKKEISNVERKEKKLQKAINETCKSVKSHSKRIKEQSQMLKTKIKELEKDIKYLMLTPADKEAIFSVSIKAITAFQNASDSGISEKSIKIAITVIKGIVSIIFTLLQEGMTLPAITSSLQTLIETCKEVLEIYRQEDLG